MATLTLKNISKQYKNDDHATLRSIDLTVTDDDFLVLLGPSGCGKTTLLRMIAGLIAPTEGEIWIGDRNVTDLPPQNRGIGMVFQNYALYPHMSIKKNLTFALEIARMKKEQREKEVERVSSILNIQNHLTKKPHMLSGVLLWDERWSWNLSFISLMNLYPIWMKNSAQNCVRKFSTCFINYTFLLFM